MFSTYSELTVLANSQMELKQAATRNHILRDFREIATTVAVQQEDTPSKFTALGQSRTLIT